MPQQLTRLLIVFALLLGGLLVVRHRLTPKTFGEKGHYRAAALVTIKAQPVKYAGREACADCHADVVETHRTARHQTVACEVCHGPAVAHTENPVENKLPASRATIHTGRNRRARRKSAAPAMAASRAPKGYRGTRCWPAPSVT
jgi:hypothetical protein